MTWEGGGSEEVYSVNEDEKQMCLTYEQEKEKGPFFVSLQKERLSPLSAYLISIL